MSGFGTVPIPTGAPIVELSASSISTGLKDDGFTDNAGLSHGAGLPPGMYTVPAEKFKREVLEDTAALSSGAAIVSRGLLRRQEFLRDRCFTNHVVNTRKQRNLTLLLYFARPLRELGDQELLRQAGADAFSRANRELTEQQSRSPVGTRVIQVGKSG